MAPELISNLSRLSPSHQNILLRIVSKVEIFSFNISIVLAIWYHTAPVSIIDYLMK